MAKLSGKQKKFITEYIVCLNATEAARRAGYAGDDHTLANIGYQNLRKRDISIEIDKIFQENAMSAGEVLARLSQQARGDISDVIDPETNMMNWKHAKALGVSHLIKKANTRTIVSEDHETHIAEIELYSAQEALKVLAKYHDLLSNKLVIEDWRSQAIADIKAGHIQYDELASLFDRDLATELFLLAKVPVSVDSE